MAKKTAHRDLYLEIIFLLVFVLCLGAAYIVAGGQEFLSPFN